MSVNSERVIVYTDGACTGNPGPGGYAAILLWGGQQREVTGGYRLTTNNRMELMAVIAALRSLKRHCAVTLHADSQYVVDAMTKGWVQKWQAKGWRRTEGAVANVDLWQEVLKLCTQHDVVFAKVRGHANDVLNNACDKLARQAAAQPGLPPDEIYERTAGKPGS